jgi:translation initiation factor IF-2
MTGIQIKGYNDIEERDVIESYHEVAIKRNLSIMFINKN